MRLTKAGRWAGIVFAIIIWWFVGEPRFSIWDIDGAIWQFFELLFVCVICGAAGWFIGSFFILVRETTAVVVETHGKYYATIHAGIGLVPPIPFSKIRKVMSLQIRSSELLIRVKTSDNAFMFIPVSVQYRIPRDRVKEALYELEHPEMQIGEYVKNSILSSAVKMSFEDVFGDRSRMERKIMTELQNKFYDYGYFVVDVLVDDPEPSREVMDAFNKVIAAERQKDAAAAEGQALQIIEEAKAKAEANSIQLKAEGLSAARLTMADGNAEALNMMTEGVEGLDVVTMLKSLDNINLYDTLREAARQPGTLIISPTESNLGELANMMAAMRASAHIPTPNSSDA